MNIGELSDRERKDIEEILRRRANEVASFISDLNGRISDHIGKPFRVHDVPGSVELAIEREVSRLRTLAAKLALPVPAED